MNENTELSIRRITIEDWMIDLIDDDRTVDGTIAKRLRALDWMFAASLTCRN